ncbi:metal-dependent hydrolase [Stenotrophomonas sp. PS02289]|uniref:metal-dependent hydrolase n=1 Tax=Stenotrophomonas sp. PS02289 TaxID=2991422 RepID=UPI00249C7C70|nr:metal-dependent hydrolase [Stenotrophomonas sp. PS02289]
MSSIAGHAAAGVAFFMASRRWLPTRSWWAALPFVALAVCPDLDYFAVWLFDYAADPRITHSLLFAMVTALLVWIPLATTASTRLPFLALLTASASHPLLDLAVGAHPVPVLWPLGPELSAPVGLLPSAGALSLGNYYLWRNVVIELGVLLPALALIVACCRRYPPQRVRIWTLRLILPWSAMLAWSMSLPR